MVWQSMGSKVAENRGGKTTGGSRHTMPLQR